ncbi:MAG: hypothetical protein F4X00_01200 [Gemmatimonadetes bacterium]|nr:hypothetical protein [Gemmatimonadota bacterium]
MTLNPSEGGIESFFTHPATTTEHAAYLFSHVFLTAVLLEVIGKYRPQVREIAEDRFRRFLSGKLALQIEPFGTVFDRYVNDPRFAGLVSNHLENLCSSPTGGNDE